MARAALFDCGGCSAALAVERAAVVAARAVDGGAGGGGFFSRLHVYVHARGDLDNCSCAEPHEAAGFITAGVQNDGVAAKLLLHLCQRVAHGRALKSLHVHPVTPTMPMDSTFIPLTISLYESTATAGRDGSTSLRTKLRT